MINRQRLGDVFKTLVEIDSVSMREKELSDKIVEIMRATGVDISEMVIDAAAVGTGSDTGNLIIKIPGKRPSPPLLLCGHMDTVQPGNGVKAHFKDGIFTSDGTTILGADDKSALAIIIEVIHTIVDLQIETGPLEILFTICEEIGLQGAKNLDFSLLEAKYGYVLDISDTQAIVTRAPAANRFTFDILGKDAHAGAAPEKGINAIAIAAEAISKLQVGRIDPETTCNIGLINGGLATNIVPNHVTVQGEVRSHDDGKLTAHTQHIINTFEAAVNRFKKPGLDGVPTLEYTIENDFLSTHIPEDHLIIQLAQRAAAQLGREIVPQSTGGGADANVFFEKGIITAVIGTGMTDMHTVNESIRLNDMADTANLLLEIIKQHTEENG